MTTISTQQSVLESLRAISEDQLSLFCSHLLQNEDIKTAEVHNTLNNCVKIISGSRGCINTYDIREAAEKSGLKLTNNISIIAYSDSRVLMNVVVTKNQDFLK